MDDYYNATTTSAMSVDHVDMIGGGWDRFVYIFSSIPSDEDDDDDDSDAPRDYGGWDIDSESEFWSFEAIVIFLIMAATLGANLYFWFFIPTTSSKATSKDTQEPQEQQEAAPAHAAEVTAMEEEEEEEEPSSSEQAKEEMIDPETLDEVQLDPPQPPTTEEEEGSTATTKRQRLYHLDNLKVFLVFVVFIQHVAQYQTASFNPSLDDKLFISLVSLNSSWFMQLFFGISAYFVPTSLQRKGTSWFIKDKVQQLGLPMLVLSFVIVPIRHWMTAILTNKDYEYRQQFGVSWFLFWLLIFNVMYVVVVNVGAFTTTTTTATSHHLTPKKVIDLLQSIWVRLGCGIVLGLLQGTIAYAQNGRWIVFGSFGLQWTYFPSYVAFFVLGILVSAQRKNDDSSSSSTPPTLPLPPTTATTSTEQQQQQQQQNSHCKTTVTTTTMPQAIIASMIASIGLVSVSFLQDDMSAVAKSYLWGLSSGFMTISFPQVLLSVFETWMNLSNKLTQFLTRIAYTSYLIHSEFIIFPLTLIYIGIIRIGVGGGNEENIPNDGWVWLGGLFVSLLGLPLCSLLSWYVCKIPCLRNIL